MTKNTLWENPVIGYNAPQSVFPGGKNVAIGITSPSMRHSPLPFDEPMLEDESGVYSIRDANGMITARVYSAADATFVRRACNNHEALLAAAKLAQSYLGRLHAEVGSDRYLAWLHLGIAIAKAEAE